MRKTQESRPVRDQQHHSIRINIGETESKDGDKVDGREKGRVEREIAMKQERREKYVRKH